MVRFFKHLMWPEWRLKFVLDQSSRKLISEAVQKAEVGHKAEIKVFIEGSFSWRELYLGVTAKEKALDVFALHRVWDTEANTGILIYVLLADHKVELVFDRGILPVISKDEAQAITQNISQEISKSGIAQGLILGVNELQSILVKRIPDLGKKSDLDKLDNEVIVSS